MTVTGVSTTVTAVEFDPFAAHDEIAKVVPTTEAQREVWLGHSLGREAALSFNESISLKLNGALDIPALQTALRCLSERHESLRATVSEDGMELLISARGTLEAVLMNLSEHSAAEVARAIAECTQQAVELQFDLARGPLVRALLISDSERSHTLVLTCHHIICDGWSFGVIVRELMQLYAALRERRDVDLPQADSFAEYSAWLLDAEQREQASKDEAYWIAQYDAGAPVLDLPTDRPRPARRAFESARLDVCIPAQLVTELRKIAGRSGASLFSLLLGFFSALMARLSVAETVVIGVPAAGQSASGKDRLVGHCVNLLPIRIDVDTEKPAREFLVQLQRLVLDAYDHQQCTFGSLLQKLTLDRDPSRLPLVSVQFNLDSRINPEELALPDLTVDINSNPRAYENFELFINATQAPEGVVLECQYNRALFDSATVRRWLALYCEALARLPERTDHSIGSLLTPTEGELQFIAAQNATEAPYDLEVTVHQLIARACVRTPSRLAIQGAGQELTYGELEARSNQLARVLRHRGVAQGQLVGLCAPRTPEMVVAQLAILKAGAAYVPLDPGFPSERLAFMAQDAQLSLMVTTSALSSSVTWPRERSLWLDTDAAIVAEQDIDSLPSDAVADATSMSPAYVIYTSGSTGKPKGVVVQHQAVVNFLESMAQRPGVTEHDRLVAVTTLSFDIAVLELLLPLTLGAQVVLATREQTLDGGSLRTLLAEVDATVMQATPATWRLLLEAGWSGSSSFKALVGGEALPLELVHLLTARAGEVWNMYGPTETTVWSTCWRVEPNVQSVRIGAPIANTQIHVLDSQLRPCPIGVAGEIFIGGDGVTLGYWNRPELTAERFLDDPFRAAAGAKLYRTGDRGRWSSDAQLEHLGRLDFQVKVRGFRIELGEIEAKLAGHPAVASSVVIVREDRPGDVRLVAYVVPKSPLPNAAEFKAFLRTNLPEYMLPQHFVELAALPLTPNGKIDRKRLPAPLECGNDARAERVPPTTALERRVLGAIEDVLNLRSLSMTDDFFAMGGHSLLAARLVGQLNREFDLQLRLQVLFESPTAEKLTRAILSANGAHTPARPPINRRSQQVTAPLTLMQQRIFIMEQLHPGRVVYNAPSCHRLRGRFDEVAFDMAFREMLRRQGVLRTSVLQSDGGYVQLVDDTMTYTLLPAEDITSIPASRREQCLSERLETLVAHTFSMDKGPLFLARLFRLADDDHVLLFMPHHVIWDGWSFDILYAEMSALYSAFVAGRPSPLPELPVTYGDFAQWHTEWMHSPEIAQQLCFWKEQYARFGSPGDAYADFPRQPLSTGAGGNEFLQLTAQRATQLRDLAKQCGTTLSMVSLSMYVALMSQWLRDPNPAVGIPVRGRPTPDLDGVMGFFNNMLPLRVPVDHSLSARDWIKQVHKRVTAAFAHQDVPFEMLAEEAQRLYQVMFTYQDARDRQTRWADLEHSRIPIMQKGATEDINLWLVETPSGIEGGVQYNADLFLPATAAMLRDRYVHLIEELILDAEQSVQALLAPAPRERGLLKELSAVSGEGSQGLIALWSALDASPGRVVIRTAETALTASQFIQKVQLAERRLSNAPSFGCDSVVVIAAADPLVHLIVGAAALRAGARTLHWESIVETALSSTKQTHSSVVVISDRTHAAGMNPDLIAASDIVDGVQQLDLDVQITGNAPTTPLDAAFLDQWLHSMKERVQLEAGQRVLSLGGVHQTRRFVEGMLALTAGAELVSLANNATSDVETPTALFAAQRFDVLFASAGAVKRLAAGPSTTPWPRMVAVNVTKCTAEIVEVAQQRGARVLGFYEARALGIPIAAGQIHAPQDYSLCGRALVEGLVIADEGGRPLPVGAPGELYIERPGAAHIATDSLLRWRCDGVLQYLGELHNIAVVEGRRVELDAVDEALRAHPQIEQAVTVGRVSSHGDVQLIAYVVPRGDMPDNTALTAFVEGRLPSGTAPRRFVALNTLPTLADGSVDRRKLPPVDAQSSERIFVAPRTQTERAIAEIWTELLGVSRISADDNFFDLGGYSLLAVRMLARLESALGVNLPLATLLHSATCSGLAGLADRATTSAQEGLEQWRPLVLIQQGGNMHPPLFCIHAIGGNVLYYRQLADVLPPEQTVYGLQAIGLDGLTPPLESISEMAQRYRAEIRTVQPRGPYYLCGGSMGGTIAFEMARQYESEGETVALVALFDTSGPVIREESHAEPEGVVAQLASYFKPDGQVGFLGRVQRRVRRVFDERKLEELKDTDAPLPPEMRWKVVEAANYRALAAYKEGPYRGVVTLFRALDEPDHKHAPPDLTWGHVALGGVEIIELPGTHAEFIEEPALQRAFRDVVLSVQDGARPRGVHVA